MKGLYIYTGNLEASHSGVSKKIERQIIEFSKNNIEMTAVNLRKKLGVTGRIINLCPLIPGSFFNELNRKKKNIDFSNVDFIYIRKFTFDLFFLSLLFHLKKRHNIKKIILEIPTYPYDNEYSTIFRKLLLFKDKFSRFLWKRTFDRIVTFSEDSYINRVECINISNGIDMEGISLSEETSSQDNTNSIKLVAVANFAYWHGYDRLIYGLKDYYDKDDLSKEVTLHLVGFGKELNKYKKLVEKLRLEDKVFFYGKKNKKELVQIYKDMDIAVDSLGRHRSNIWYNSSLKGKEYGANGLPIISGVRTELDKFTDYPYYYKFPSDESLIDIQKVVSFYHKIYKNSNRIKVKNEIYYFTKENFEFSVTFSPIINYIFNE